MPRNTGLTADGKKTLKAGSLSTASPYEQLFGTRHRQVGRPTGTEPLFSAPEVDPVIALIAKRRAYAVVHEEQRDRMSEVFAAELKVLKRRGLSVVAADAGVALKLTEGAEHG